MDNPTIQFQKVLIDGQTVTIPTLDEWENLMRDSVYLGSPVYYPNTKKWVGGLLSFTAKHRDKFCLGMYRPQGLKSWVALSLLRMGDNWQRVHIEHIACGECDWRGEAANPTEPSLYFGVPNELAVLRSAWMLPFLGCPNCGASLPRTAVWTESASP